MRWNALKLRTKLLLSYGVILTLTLILVLFLIQRLGVLNTQITRLNADVAAEVAVGVSLADQVAHTQQAIDRYLQKPNDAALQSARSQLETLSTAIAQAKASLSVPAQQQKLNDLSVLFAKYQADFTTLSALIGNQRALQRDLNVKLFELNQGTSNILGSFISGDTAPEYIILRLASTHSDVFVVNLLSARMLTEQNPELGKDAQKALRSAQLTFELQRSALDPATSTLVDNTLKDITRSSEIIGQISENIILHKQQHEQLLNVQGQELQVQSDAISNEALKRLTTTTTQLEFESNLAQQIGGGAMVLTVVFTLGLASQLAHTLTRPITHLVAATRRVSQGDYSATVETRSGGEIGQLAADFNSMTQSLKHQRSEVEQQQQELTAQNSELEQALHELRAATSEREALAETVRTMSVPVISILQKVILIPLVGEMDVQRSQLLLDRLLHGITEQSARIAILDITGVPMVDEGLVDWLVKATLAARLLGTRCILVGISPEVAQALVASGTDLSQLSTRADLRSGVEHALQTLKTLR